MSVNVDAVNERLNGLVTLLQAVGVDSLDEGEVDRVSKNFNKDGGLGAIPGARQLDDSQIEAIIKKLQQAQEEAPQIIAALEAHAEARSLTGERKSSKQQKQSQHQQREKEEEEEEEEEEEDDDDEEYDEDGNYPMVGPGCSDDCSVMSDLTTPTVVNSGHVPDEEHYRDNTLPPMIIGGGGGGAPAMVVAAPKRKNLVSQVGRPGQSGQQRRGAPSPRSGAAASRRKNYQSTMAKLHENPNGMGHSGPPAAPRKQPSSRSTGSRPPSSSGSKKRVPKSRGTDNFSGLAGHSSTPSGSDWDVPEQGGWDNFDSKPKSPSKGAAPTMIDDDGFLVGGSFDPFNTGAAPAKAKNPFKSSAGDLEYNARPSRDVFSANTSSNNGFGGSGSGPPRKTRPRKPQSSNSGQGQPVRRERPTGAPSNGVHPGRIRRSRRASAL